MCSCLTAVGVSDEEGDGGVADEGLIAAVASQADHGAIGRLQDEVIVHSHHVDVLEDVPVVGCEYQPRCEDAVCVCVRVCVCMYVCMYVCHATNCHKLKDN